MVTDSTRVVKPAEARNDRAMASAGHPHTWRQEWPLALLALSLAFVFGAPGVAASLVGTNAGLIAWLLVLCGVLFAAAIAIVRHADELARRLGEPRGTLLLTLAITGLEVAMVGFVMSSGEPKPTLARDTMFAVVMLVFNLFLGVAMLLGGLKHREQPYSLQGAISFLSLIVPLNVLCLVLPNFTRSTPGPTLSTFQMVFLSLTSLGIYAVFLMVQIRRHRDFFIETPSAAEPGLDHSPAHSSSGVDEDHWPDQRLAANTSGRPTWLHAAMLAIYGVPLVLLSKKLALPIDTAVERLDAPVALGGMILAVLVLSPESIAAVRAAYDNRLQRSVNILLGSVLASTCLTIPLVIAISLITGRELIFGLEPAQMVLLALTLVSAILTFSMPRTNLLLGCVHLLLFGAYFVLLFDGA